MMDETPITPEWQAREQMRRDCLETPPRLQRDLLEHFASAYPKGKP